MHAVYKPNNKATRYGKEKKNYVKPQLLVENITKQPKEKIYVRNNQTKKITKEIHRGKKKQKQNYQIEKSYPC